MRRTRVIFDAPEWNITTGEWKYKIEGYAPGGEWLVIVFCFKELDKTFLITAWAVEDRRKKEP